MNTADDLSLYFQSVERNKLDLNWNLARRRAFYTRSKAIEHLDKHLIDFETHFTRHHGKLLWASSAENAKTELNQLLQGNSVFTHSHRLLREIGMNQVADWHYLDSDSQQTPPENACALVFPSFYISENGSLMLTHTDPAFDRLLTDYKKVIYLIGIEQVCPNMNEAENLINLLARNGEGKKDFSSVHISTGNKQGREKYGPVESWVMMLDNGRSNLFAEIPQRQSLYCIHCGACTKYSNFQLIHTEPVSVIDLIKAPFVKGPEYFRDNFSIPLSGRATHSCPVGIDLKGLVLENRRLAVERKLDGRSESLAWKAWRTAMLSRKWLNKGASVKSFTLKSFFKKYWGEDREFPKPHEQTFNEWWVQSRGKLDEF